MKKFKFKHYKIIVPVLLVIIGLSTALFFGLGMRHSPPEARQPAPSSQIQSSNPRLSADENPVSGENQAADVEETDVVEQPPAENPRQALRILGQLIRVETGGQAQGQQIIDADYGVTSTWGGAALDVTDGLSTHIIGHNPGVFNILFNLAIGDPITVYDTEGRARDYTVRQLVQVNDYADLMSNPAENLWDAIVGIGNREQIVLQTCVNDDVNLIVFAD